MLVLGVALGSEQWQGNMKHLLIITGIGLYALTLVK